MWHDAVRTKSVDACTAHAQRMETNRQRHGKKSSSASFCSTLRIISIIILVLRHDYGDILTNILLGDCEKPRKMKSGKYV